MHDYKRVRVKDYIRADFTVLGSTICKKKAFFEIQEKIFIAQCFY